MSEGDVSGIRDEDVLRRMWQQTEDFSRKKEIRAHMYRLREERLRNLYSPEPSIDGKGCEFTSEQGQGHVRSFADQSFQSMKSKEVRDAGSPPKEFTYRGQDLKELSNAGWNVESENRTTDDGHTQIKSVHASIEGKYNVEGGRGQFGAIDKHNETVTEYYDDNTSLKRNESSSNTAAHEQVIRQIGDGTHFSSTTSSSTSSSKFHQTSSTQSETLPFEMNDKLNQRTKIFSDKNYSIEEQNPRRVDFEQAELISKKIDYPDDNTKVVVETRLLPDGTKVTSTRREFKEPVAQSGYSKKQVKTENKKSFVSSDHRRDFNEFSSNTSQTSMNIQNNDIVDRQRATDIKDFINNTHIQVHSYNTEDSKSDVVQQEFNIRADVDHQASKIIRTEATLDSIDLKEHFPYLKNNKNNSNSTGLNFTQNIRENSQNTHDDQTNQQQFNEKRVHELKSPTHPPSRIDLYNVTSNIEDTSNFKNPEHNERHATKTDDKVKDNVEVHAKSDEYKISNEIDYSQNKISNNWSATHQAWASTLRSDTPIAARPPTRSSSPGSRTHQSSTSSLRSSISPDKTCRKSVSRGSSPLKNDKLSPSRNNNQSPVPQKVHKISRYTSPDKELTNSKLNTSPDRKTVVESHIRSSISPDKPPKGLTNRRNTSPETKQSSKLIPNETLVKNNIANREIKNIKPDVRNPSESTSATRESPQRILNNRNTSPAKISPDRKTGFHLPGTNDVSNPENEISTDTSHKTISSKILSSNYEKYHSTRHSPSPEKVTQSTITGINSKNIIHSNKSRSVSPIKPNLIDKSCENINDKLNETVKSNNEKQPIIESFSDPNTKTGNIQTEAKSLSPSTVDESQDTSYDKYSESALLLTQKRLRKTSPTKQSEPNYEKENENQPTAEKNVDTYNNKNIRQPISSHDDKIDPKIKTTEFDILISENDSRNESTLSDYKSINLQSTVNVTEIKQNLSLQHLKKAPLNEKNDFELPNSISKGKDLLENKKSQNTVAERIECNINENIDIPNYNSSNWSQRLGSKSKSPEGSTPLLDKPLKKSVSPIKSVTSDHKHKKSSDFIANEKFNESKNKNFESKDRPRQLVTPSTSPTRKPNNTEKAPSTGQSSPTTSVSGFIYFSSTDKEENVIGSDYQISQSKTYDNDQKTTVTTKTPSKLPYRTPSPEKRTSPTKDILPRKSSLKKSSTANTCNSPTEKTITNFDDISDSHTGNIKKNPLTETEPVLVAKQKPPLERRETYEERCRKILGMIDDESSNKRKSEVITSKKIKEFINHEKGEDLSITDFNTTSITDKKTSVTKNITRPSETPFPAKILKRGDIDITTCDIQSGTVDIRIPKGSPHLSPEIKPHSSVTSEMSDKHQKTIQKDSEVKMRSQERQQSRTPSPSKHAIKSKTFHESTTPFETDKKNNSRSPSPLKNNTETNTTISTSLDTFKSKSTEIDHHSKNTVTTHSLKNNVPTRSRTPSPLKTGAKVSTTDNTHPFPKISSSHHTPEPVGGEHSRTPSPLKNMVTKVSPYDHKGQLTETVHNLNKNVITKKKDFKTVKPLRSRTPSPTKKTTENSTNETIKSTENSKQSLDSKNNLQRHIHVDMSKHNRASSPSKGKEEINETVVHERFTRHDSSESVTETKTERQREKINELKTQKDFKIQKAIQENTFEKKPLSSASRENSRSPNRKISDTEDNTKPNSPRLHKYQYDSIKCVDTEMRNSTSRSPTSRTLLKNREKDFILETNKTNLKEETTNLIQKEREQKILEKVNNSLRKISPDRKKELSCKHESPEKPEINKDTIHRDLTSDDLTDGSQDVEIILTRPAKINEKTSYNTAKITDAKIKYAENVTNLGDFCDQEELPKEKNLISKLPSRNTSPTKEPTKITKPSESPTKSRSISPRKPLSPTEQSKIPKSNSPKGTKEMKEPSINQNKKNISTNKSEKNTFITESRKTTLNNSTKTLTTKTSTSNKISQINNKKTESEIRRTPKPKEKDLENVKNNNKVARTTSDSVLKTKKSPLRTKSKPEIKLSDSSTVKTTKNSSTVSRTSIKEPHNMASTKPKSITTLNTSTENDDIIIDIQQAKSSRESSPDRICPTPINFSDDVGTPRFPDEVNEPDDDFRNRIHHTIQETESLVDDIIEISEDEELFMKKKDDDCIAEQRESVIISKNKNSENEQIKPFNQPKQTIIKDKDSGRQRQPILNELQSDECLLTVSEKVNKFTKGSLDTKESRTNSRAIVDDYDKDTIYQDDYTKLSVNDKAHLFIETAEKVKCSKTKPKQKNERLDLSSFEDSVQSDECLLSVSDKVNKFVKSAEKFLNESYDIEEKDKKIKEQHDRIIKDIVQSSDEETNSTKENTIKNLDQENQYVSDNKLEALVKESASSNNKTKNYCIPNVQFPNTPSKITTLRSNESVKKAKELFENITSTSQITKDTTQIKTTKLKDIGVIKSYRMASPNHLNTGNDFSATTTVKCEIGTPSLLGLNNTATKGKLPPTNQHDILSQKISQRIDTAQADYPRNKSPSRQIVESTITKSVSLEHSDSPDDKSQFDHIRDNVRRSQSPQNDIPGYLKPTKTSQIKEEARNVEENKVKTRRGSEKFGVELRRTSLEKSNLNSERRRSSDHQQPCIEDIFDVELLEQMLEKVVGYEQRRRIRAQIRIVKKHYESEHKINTNTYVKSPKSTVIKTIAETTLQNSPEISHLPKISPERQIKIVSKDFSSHEQKSREEKIAVQNEHTKARKSVDNHFRSQSSDKPVIDKPESKTKSSLRQPSPEKKIRSRSPDKSLHEKSKTNRFNEYASAYMKKIGNNTEQTNSLNSRIKTTTQMQHNKKVEEEKNNIEIYSKISKDDLDKISVENVHVIQNIGKRSPSPDVGKKARNEKLYQRSPSPDFKRSKAESTKETKETSIYDIQKKNSSKQIQEDKPSWVTNRNLKKITSETRSVSNKKIDYEKQRYRATSPSKIISKPTDVITSSYGIGPLDANGKPLFGIKALRNGASNYQVKGTVIRQEFHSRNGGEPEGTVSVTAYSTEPEELEKLLQVQGDRPSRLHGLAAITTTKKFGGTTGTTLREAHSKEERATLDQFTHSDRKVTEQSESVLSKRNVHETQQTKKVESEKDERRENKEKKEKRQEEKKTIRQSSVKSLTEKYIKTASESSRIERTSFPKAGLILRTSNMKDSISSDSSAQAGLARSDSEHSLGSVDDSTEMTSTVTEQTPNGRTITTTTRTTHGHTHKQTRSQAKSSEERSFLDSNTKVTGVQDILTRMKNADIVIEDGDTNEDAEARALLNKFLGATVLMAGMQDYVAEKPGGKMIVKQETVRTSGGKTNTNRSVQEFDLEQCWDERELRKLLDECTDYEQRRRLRARLRTLMAEQEACASAVTDALAAAGESTDGVENNEAREEEEVTTVTSSVRRDSSEKTVSSSTTTKTSKVIESLSRSAPKPVSPFAKFRQLEKQNSTNSPNSPGSPQSPGSPSQPFFKFTDPVLACSAVTIKERLLQWCRDKTRDYENVKLENFSTSWADGLAFCALVHHFLPDAFDYSKLTPEKRRHNFTLAFKVADEKAGIYPLLDVEDMVTMRRPDWKCVFTYVQAIHRRFKDHN